MAGQGIQYTTAGTIGAQVQLAHDRDAFRWSDLNILTLTWNVSGISPDDPSMLSRFIGLFEKSSLPQVVSIGLQEVYELKGFSVVSNFFKNEAPTLKKWVDCFVSLILEVDSSYYLASSEMLEGLVSLNFVHRSVTNKVKAHDIEEIKTGMMGLVGTKGSLVSLLTFEDKRIIFCNTHLPSGDKVDARSEIIHGLYKTYCKPSVCDLFVLYGDLNLRLQVNKEDYRRAIKNNQIYDADNRIDWNYLISRDEVKSGSQPVLSNYFFEQNITFPMTYRLNKKSSVPSYCPDRVASWYITSNIGLTECFAGSRRLERCSCIFQITHTSLCQAQTIS